MFHGAEIGFASYVCAASAADAGMGACYVIGGTMGNRKDRMEMGYFTAQLASRTGILSVNAGVIGVNLRSGAEIIRRAKYKTHGLYRGLCFQIANSPMRAQWWRRQSRKGDFSTSTGISAQ